MSRYLVRDPATREIEIDESALPFWQDREGYTVIGPVSEPGDEPDPAQSVEVAQPQPEETGTPTPARKAASRPAQNVEGAGR